ncbi:hypothetical protein BGZ93_002752 [Podila epicladia]|nr:hypothetical protein BGZ92_006771 [Podila epicladia]KAG0081228.1 hypothetical protein BGZ93_002752 [Podila epicladia]
MLVLPPFLDGVKSAKPYANDWYMTIPASAAEDGIVQVTTAVGNPFFSANLDVVTVDASTVDPFAVPTTFIMGLPFSSSISGFKPLEPSAYSVKGGETKQVTFKWQFMPNPGDFDQDYVPYWYNQSTADGGKVGFQHTMTAVARIGTSLEETQQYWYSDYINGHMDDNGVFIPGPPMNLHFGSDFTILSQYYAKVKNPTPAPVAPPTSVSSVASPSASPTTTAVSVPPVTPTAGTTDPAPTSPMPTSASPSPVSPSPVSPSPVAPSP